MSIKDIKFTWDNPILTKKEPLTWDDLKPIFRPDEFTHWGKVVVNKKTCTQCGLCVQNCLAGTLEMDEDNYPRVKLNWDGMPGHPDHPYPCFACWQCLVPCPTNSLSIESETWFDGGFWKTLPHRVPLKLPQQPRDAEGNPTDWNETEKLVMTRRSTREYKDKPVPEYIINRVLEAGRFSPTGGNYQGLRYIVITDKAFINELSEATCAGYDGMWELYKDDEKVKGMAIGQYQSDPARAPWGWNLDPRIMRAGIGVTIKKRIRNIFVNAPCVIVIVGDMRCIGQPQIQAGIAGQNMVMVAHSLGVKSCWVGFPNLLNGIPPLMEKLCIYPPFQIQNCLSLGYPKFKTDGVVPRQFWPITWFREGVKGPEIQTEPLWPEVNKPGMTSALENKLSKRKQPSTKRKSNRDSKE